MRLPIEGLSDEAQEAVSLLLGQLAEKRSINKTRQNYFEAAQKTKHFGIAVPPHMVEFETTLSWGEGACTHLNDRINLEGFEIPDSDVLPLNLSRIIRQNKLLAESTMAHLEAQKYGPAFTMALAGYAGEPDVVVRSLSARVTTGEWNPNSRRLTKILTVTGAKWGRVTEMIYADDEMVYTIAEGDRGGLTVVHSAGVPMCPGTLLPFRPDLDNPFGRSRLSHPVMRAIDRAQRTLLRSEITAEFFSAPQRYLLGADEDIFTDEDGKPIPTWDALIGRISAIGRDEEGQVPSVYTAPQVSMQPHTDMSRHDAAIFSSLVNVPVSVLGVVQDNPDSAEAMEVRWDALNKVAERAHVSFGAGWVETLQKAVMIRDGLDDPPEELDELESKWRPASMPTRAAMADAATKEIGAIPWVAETEEALRMFGHDRATRKRMLADRRRAQGGARIGALAAAGRGLLPVAAGSPGAAE
ncbi:phage portal protein [Litorihabitans aurantiacus]|nr:phage portal protein [Litorihabitans aurantiacus]